MTILINLRLHTGRIAGIFITGIFGNFYTKQGGFLSSKTGIPSGPVHKEQNNHRHQQIFLKSRN